MMQLIEFNTAKKSAKDKLYVNKDLENEFLGFAKQLFFKQVMEDYGKVEVIRLLYQQLNFENRCFLDDFISKNPGLKTKYDLTPKPLKKSAN